LEQIAEPLIGLPRRAEPGVLPHGPQLAEIHVAVDTAGIWIFAGRRGRGGNLLRPVERLDGNAASGGARLGIGSVAHGRNSRFSTTSSRVISRTISPRWFLPWRRNLTTPAIPGRRWRTPNCPR